MGIAQEFNQYELTVNDSRYVISGSWLGESLLYVLRERLGLYGSKNACEQGECGSCSVMMDDVLVCSCLVLAANAEGREIKTIVSVADGNELSDVQEAFIDTGAIQCGFCTPGFVMSLFSMFKNNKSYINRRRRNFYSNSISRNYKNWSRWFTRNKNNNRIHIF